MGVLFEKSKRSGEKRNASPHLTAGELHFELFFKKTDKIVFERRILSFSAGGGNFTLNPDGFCSVHKLFNFGIYRQKNGCHVPCSPKLKSSSVGKKFNRDRQPSFRITCHTKMAMMDTKMAQFRIEPLTEALPESIHSLDLALQI